jgi:hypothetical protein
MLDDMQQPTTVYASQISSVDLLLVLVHRRINFASCRWMKNEMWKRRAWRVYSGLRVEGKQRKGQTVPASTRAFDYQHSNSLANTKVHFQFTYNA